jgi:hypothetical protein
MKQIQKIGGWSALYMAAAYLVGLVLFIAVLDYPSITDPMQKVTLLAEKTSVIYATNLIMYQIFGVALILFVFGLHERLKAGAPQVMRIAAAIGVVWAGMLIASGLVANAGIAPVMETYAVDPALASAMWYKTETLANELSSANGELLGGVLVLLVSLAGLRARSLPAGLIWLGAAVGAIGLVSCIPGLHDLTAVFGLSQIVWFVWMAVILLKKEPAASS